MFSPTNEDLGVLTTADLKDVFNVIHSATLHVSIAEMQTEVLHSLQNAFSIEGGVFFIGDREYESIDNGNMTGMGINLRYHDQWVRYYSRRDPFQQEGAYRRGVCKVDDILPYRRWTSLKIYNEFYRPQNIHYKLSLCLRSGDRTLGLIGMFRSKEQQDFSECDVAKARILVPYLTSALENLIRMKELSEKTPVTTQHQLTRRESDIVRCVCQGLTNDEIGKKLYISRYTVETHLKNIFDKTGVKHRAGLSALLQSI